MAADAAREYDTISAMIAAAVQVFPDRPADRIINRIRGFDSLTSVPEDRALGRQVKRPCR
jgi:hypothetical protein